jgi:hypothetical protein
MTCADIIGSNLRSDRQHFIGPHNEMFSVAMRVSNPDRSP